MTHRRYECDGYSMELRADEDGAFILIDPGSNRRVDGAIIIPWKTMEQLCRVVSDWSIAAATRFKEVNGEVKEFTEFR